VEHVYRSRRFDDALALVKNNLGPNAFILSATQLTADPKLGGAAGTVEIKAIAPGDAQKLGLTSRAEAKIVELERRLRQAQVPSSLARALARGSERELGEQGVAGGTLASALSKALGRQMIFGGPAGSGGRVVALVGPTGVGKTTTAAKLAAHGALLQHHYVALICIDLFRIGGAEQLERYAELLGIPLEVATDLHSLNLALRSLSDAELVILDTAGCSSRDSETLQDIAECLRGIQEPVETHLCLEATIREQEMEAMINRYSVLSPVRLTITKLDDAVNLGSIIAAQSLSGLPLSYLTTGQRVPEDIELATPDRIAEYLCTRREH
jgi:flagellar biosynthesis protein FlhF